MKASVNISWAQLFAAHLDALLRNSAVVVAFHRVQEADAWIRCRSMPARTNATAGSSRAISGVPLQDLVPMANGLRLIATWPSPSTTVIATISDNARPVLEKLSPPATFVTD